MFFSGFIQASISGTVMIGLISIIRFFLKEKLPKRTLVLLWDIILLRMLFLASIPSPINVAQMFQSESTDSISVISESDTVNSAQAEVNVLGSPESTVAESNYDVEPIKNKTEGSTDSCPVVELIWLCGAVIMLSYFGIAYWRFCRKFRRSTPVCDKRILEFIQSQGMKRKVVIKKCGAITSPLTYGLIRPVIMLPVTFDFRDKQSEKMILCHEIIHVKRFDFLRKAIAVMILSLYWFNPFAWYGIIQLNKDIELACDERVLKCFGGDVRQKYALALIDMMEQQNNIALMQSNFSQNAIEERIVAIMKTKKASRITAIFAMAAVVSLTGLSAFSLNSENENEVSDITSPIEQNESISDNISTYDSDENNAGTDSAEPYNRPIQAETEPAYSETISTGLIVPKAAAIDIVLHPASKSDDIQFTYIPANSGCEVYAAEAGICEYYASTVDMGSCVCIKLDNGFYVYYFSLEPYGSVIKRNTVSIKVGERIEAGQLIGYTHENGMWVNDYNLGSGVGYWYTQIAPPAYPNGEGALAPYLLQSYQNRGFTLSYIQQAILEDYNLFIQTHSEDEWYESENWNNWVG